MEFNKSFTIVASVFIIMFFGMFYTLSISNAYINSPSSFKIVLEIENETREVIDNLNGSIVINYYYGNNTKQYSFCKDTVRNYYVEKETGVIVSEDVWSDVYECNFIK